MTPAYDAAQWNDFAQTVAGGAAALAGLLFVGLSLNLAEVLKFPGVPARAGATLGLTIAVLLTAVFLATPGQHAGALAAELLALGFCSAGGAVLAGILQRRVRGARWAAYTTLTLFLPGALLMAGAVSLWLQAGGGLYWITAAVTAGFAAATANAWVLLVEIKR